MNSVLSLPASEYAGWRAHFQRRPPDAVERLLSKLITMQLPDVDDTLLRPYAYTPSEHQDAAERREEAREAREKAEAARVEAERREKAQSALGAFRARSQGG